MFICPMCGMLGNLDGWIVDHSDPNLSPCDLGAAKDRVIVLENALRKISTPVGVFSLDQLTHAHNTIENMVNIATEALDQ